MSSDVFQKIFNIISNEGIIHDGSSVTLWHYFEKLCSYDWGVAKERGWKNESHRIIFLSKLWVHNSRLFYLEDFLKFQYFIPLICCNQVCHRQDFGIIFVSAALSWQWQRVILKIKEKKKRIKFVTYGFASCPSNGLTSDCISMLASTKYL